MECYGTLAIKEELYMRHDRFCWYCGRPETVSPIDLHHVEKRSVAPERINDATNLVPLCRPCHERTEESDEFYKRIKHLWSIKK